MELNFRFIYIILLSFLAYGCRPASDMTDALSGRENISVCWKNVAMDSLTYELRLNSDFLFFRGYSCTS